MCRRCINITIDEFYDKQIQFLSNIGQIDTITFIRGENSKYPIIESSLYTFACGLYVVAVFKFAEKAQKSTVHSSVMFPLFHPIFVFACSSNGSQKTMESTTGVQCLRVLRALPSICVLHVSRLSRQIWKFERLRTPTDQSRTSQEVSCEAASNGGNFAGENIIEVWG